VFYHILHFFFNIFYFLFFRLKVTGLENIPKKGALIIAGNHVSLLDPPTIGTACRPRRIFFMAKPELFANPVFSFLIRQLGAFPVNRGAPDRVALKKTLELLQSGQAVGIFPEGTRSQDGTLGQAESGVIALAERSGAMIIPAAVMGTQKVCWKTPLPKIRVAFGLPLAFSDRAADKSVLQARSVELMQNIQALLIANVKD
jgi:1-acyl-sn-glycerol-3-phosphate acyltransferase